VKQDSKDNEDSHLSDQSDKTTSSLGRFSFFDSKTTLIAIDRDIENNKEAHWATRKSAARNL
jgi:hypothetical protein